VHSDSITLTQELHTPKIETVYPTTIQTSRNYNCLSWPQRSKRLIAKGCVTYKPKQMIGRCRHGSGRMLSRYYDVECLLESPHRGARSSRITLSMPFIQGMGASAPPLWVEVDNLWHCSVCGEVFGGSVHWQ